MERKEIEARLCKLPIEAAAAFAVRVGLRVLPWLVLSEEKIEVVRWPEKDRLKHLLSIFLAFDVGLLVAWGRPINRLKQVASDRATNITEYATEGHYETYASDVYARAADAAFAATYAVAEASLRAGYVYADIEKYEGDVIYFECDEYELYSVAAAAAYAAYAVSHAFEVYADAKYDLLTEFNSQIKFDLDFLKTKNARKLIESPIWNITPTQKWDTQVTRFKQAVHNLNGDFDIWLTLFDMLCNGNIIDLNQLTKRVFLPHSITMQTPQQVNSYIASLNQGNTAGPLNRVRTIFIGDGEAGKTSLIRILNNESVVEGIEPQTPGIDIREWPVPNTEIKASFWDFGGQVMVHATHQLFLRDSCLYVLLVSAREKEKATERAEYWLEHVKSFGKGAPVLIVANKADKEPVNLDEGLLKEKYPGMIKGFFQLACTEAQGCFRSQFEQFIHQFCKQLQAIGMHQVQFEKAHFSVLANLRQRTPSQAFLTHRDYDALCKTHRISEKGGLDRAWLLDILDKLGIIVHFPDMVEMEEYILNPRWLTYGIYTVMYSKQPAVTKQEVIKLLSAKPVKDHDGNQLNYPPGKCHIIFEAMRRYKLCYFLPHDPNYLIIPALLPSDIKQHGFDTSSALEFRYDFESFLPRHLISELIVESHEDIAYINEQEVVWQHGALLHNATHNTQALIQADYHFRRLTIWLKQQPAAADYLAVLRDRIERIVQRLDIKYKQIIRLPREARLDQNALHHDVEFANFKLILAQRNRGQTEYISESETVYSIGKILGVFTPQATTVGNTTINIRDSNILGDITAGNKTERSFNQGQP